MSNEIKYSLEIPQKKDAQMATDLFNSHYFYCTGETRYTRESVLVEWEQPRFSLSDDARIVRNDRGNWIAYIAVLNTESPFTENILIFRINPDFMSIGIGTLLTNWGELRAKENVFKAKTELKVIIRTSCFIQMESSESFLKERKFTISRYYFRMINTLNETRSKIELPHGLTLETYSNRKNLKEIIDCTEDCFIDHWAWWRLPDDELWEDWNHRIKTNPFHDPDLWFLVMDGVKLVALCLVDSGMSNHPKRGYIDMICVRKEYRKQGIASSLLNLAKNELVKRDKESIALHVDGSSLTGATKVYKDVGFEVDQSRMMFEKTIRKGKVYRSQIT